MPLFHNRSLGSSKTYCCPRTRHGHNGAHQRCENTPIVYRPLSRASNYQCRDTYEADASLSLV
jgi:hypothetical protein